VSTDSLAVYLNDHLAGSVAAVELLDALVGRAHGTPAEQVLRTVRVEIVADQDVLRAVLDKVGGDESRLKQAAAWLGEKLGQAKLAVTGYRYADLDVLEGLESLALGIQGKAALWRALGVVSSANPELASFHFSSLEVRAQAQYDQVELARLAAARAALGGA
jgi:hypothetical protein